MSSGEEFSAVCMTREAAFEAATNAYRQAQVLLRNGRNALIECKPALEPIGIQQRRFLHGPVLGQISVQAKVDGVRYTTDVWKEHFRKLFVPPRWEMLKTPRFDPKLGRLVQPKRATPHRIHRSTEELGVKAYAQLIDEIIQYAVVELGVEFVFTNEEQVLLTRKPAPRSPR